MAPRQRQWSRAGYGAMASARKADAPLPPGIMFGLIRRMFAVIGR
jgi:hypothetical protein